MPRSFVLMLACGAALASCPASSAVDFGRHVQPILAAKCTRCHGADKQRSGLRLDRKAFAMKGGDGGAVIVPGDSKRSSLFERVSATSLETRMPPEGEPLSQAQIATLKAWIDQGALWPDDGSSTSISSDWWSLRPLVAPSVPDVPNPGVNEIDRFIRARLAKEQMAPAPEASPRELIRRLTFDVTGLPPTPEEVADFLHQSAIRNPQSAIEDLVDRLLASPRYGERWARHWMDVAHFAETHGHDQDRIRENAWPYRDYLINAFNRDLPYSQFVQQQVAGDVLFPDDPQAVVAMGFLASGPWDESSLRDIREDTLDRQIGRYLDRDDVVTTVMLSFASMTVQCARCHDHKFDPVSQQDYYALQAVFSGVDKANREYASDPEVARHRQQLRARLEAVERKDRGLLLSAEVQGRVAQWQRGLEGIDVWRVLDSSNCESAKGATLTKLEDWSLLSSGQRPETDIVTVTAHPPLAEVTAVRLEVLTHDSLPQRGPGRQDNGNLHLSEFLVQVVEADGKTRDVKIKQAEADFNQEGWTIAKAIDGNEITAWGVHPRVGQSHEAVFELAERLTIPAEGQLRVILKQLHGRQHLIGRLRLSVTDAEPARVQPLPGDVRDAVAKPVASRTDDDHVTLAAFVERAHVTRELASLPPPTLVYAAASDFAPDNSHKPAGRPRPVHVLRRGEITQPLEEASPGALSCIAGLPARFATPDPAIEGPRRAALANWLVHHDNPLTWRSIVNRVWHYHFGRGLVETPNDFGRMGALPSHPELLDWLAVWFRDRSRAEGGGSLKALHRLIVTSATYRQSTRHVPEFAARDADNRLLWRMNRTRLDAESVRDAVLAISGRLDLRMGGPSDRQFDLQPGIHVTPRIDYAKFDLDSDAGRRRSVYRFLFRTLPDPLMDSLDCPAGDQLTAARNASVTVQQALALWNSAFITRQCEHLAERLKREDASDERQVRRAFELVLNRPATAAETADLADFAARHGIAAACRVLLNSNEFLFVN